MCDVYDTRWCQVVCGDMQFSMVVCVVAFGGGGAGLCGGV